MSMPSATHQTLLSLFRDHPELGFELARRAGAPLDEEFEWFEELTPEFDNPMSARVAVTADLATAGFVDGRPRRALVIEIQLGRDPDKEWTVVLYRVGLRHRLRCPTWAMVISPDPTVRAAFVEQMFLAEPELRPLVITPEMVPVLADLGAAIADYPAAILAAVMHANGPDAVFCATIAIQALFHVAPRDFGRYVELVSTSVGTEAMEQVREQLPPTQREQLSDWERRGAPFVMGHEEGLEQGLRAAVRTVLDTRGLRLDQSDDARIDACADPTELRELIARATTIATGTELFGS
jgi:hypothetical protein